LARGPRLDPIGETAGAVFPRRDRRRYLRLAVAIHSQAMTVTPGVHWAKLNSSAFPDEHR
jgi:hypothetical protein